MKILSIRQPWAWAIINAGKDIENRTWPTKVRGRALIHAGVSVDTTIDDDWIDFIMRSAVRRGMEPSAIPKAKDLARGGIVGSVEIIDCVTVSDSAWFFGPIGFVLRNPQPLEFIPLRGRLGFWDAPADVAALAEMQR